MIALFIGPVLAIYKALWLSTVTENNILGKYVLFIQMEPLVLPSSVGQLPLEEEQTLQPFVLPKMQ